MSEELRRRLKVVVQEIHAATGLTGEAPEWRVKEARLRDIVEKLEANLEVLRWLKKARLVGALKRAVRERRRRIQNEATPVSADNPLFDGETV